MGKKVTPVDFNAHMVRGHTIQRMRFSLYELPAGGNWILHDQNRSLSL